MSVGRCRLTLKSGKFVRSHIIPKALTRIARRGSGVMEISPATARPKLRYDSWYDSNLVIKLGEDILSAYDNYGISELKRLMLIWGGWGEAAVCPAPFSNLGASPLGVRQVDLEDGRRLRAFFLSLLWRFSATSKPEFAHINVGAEREERLRKILLKEEDDDINLFPIALFQIPQVGPRHNFVPTNEVLNLPIISGDECSGTRPMNVVRAYFDGLVVFFYLDENVDGSDDEISFLHGKKLTVATLEPRGSIQFVMHDEALAEAEALYPDEFSRIMRTISRPSR
ncbi:hypothetical protein V5F59_12500 [Xanthobacter autotrophicus DSM 431]|uniref:hypothetical protein n=1 Tax=Xanthobacter nonsaccharivorans TaxID=3119912 RepID=UPI00372B9CD8